jgi:hypothetical protein
MNIFQDLDPLYLFIAGCAVATWVLLRRSARLRRARRRDVDHLEHLPRPTADPWDGVRRDAAAMAERQQVELFDLARDFTGQIDSKMILLQQLMTQSQRQIDRLEELLREIDDRAPARPAS